jgi:hemerythrin superfamily protein
MDLDSALTGKPAEGAPATDILRADHRQAERLFAEFERAGAEDHTARVIAQSLCLALELHDTIEREVFYPAVLEIDSTAVEGAFGAHAEIEHALEDLRRHADANEALGEVVARLKHLVTAHVEEEEEQLLPRVEAARSTGSLRDLGAALIKRKEELTRSTRELEGPAT